MTRSIARIATAIAILSGIVHAPALADEDSAANAPGQVKVQRGRVRVLRQAILASDRIGVVSAELPREGDRIEADSIVVRLEDKVQRAAVKVARARADNDAPILAAEREYDVSVAEVQAAEDANSQVENAIPEIEVERLRLARDRNELRIKQAKNTRMLDELEHGRLAVELETFDIRAPFSGRVTKVHRTIGEAVRQGDPIVDLVDTERMRVEGFVPVADALRVKRGDKVVVRPIVPGFVPPEGKETTTGELVFVDVAVQPVTGLVRVWADVANPYGFLLDGLDAEMTIEFGSADDVVRSRSSEKSRLR